MKDHDMSLLKSPRSSSLYLFMLSKKIKIISVKNKKRIYRCIFCTFLENDRIDLHKIFFQGLGENMSYSLQPALKSNAPSIKTEKSKSYIQKLWEICTVMIIGIGTHLFVKVPRPGNSKVTFSAFESSCHLLLPVPIYPLIGRGNSIKCLTSELVDLSPH